jgi:hypothetical protein
MKVGGSPGWRGHAANPRLRASVPWIRPGEPRIAPQPNSLPGPVASVRAGACDRRPARSARAAACGTRTIRFACRLFVPGAHEMSQPGARGFDAHRLRFGVSARLWCEPARARGDLELIKSISMSVRTVAFPYLRLRVVVTVFIYGDAFAVPSPGVNSGRKGPHRIAAA